MFQILYSLCQEISENYIIVKESEINPEYKNYKCVYVFTHMSFIF